MPDGRVYSRDQISNKKPRPACHCDCLSAVAGAGQTQTRVSGEIRGHQGLTFNISSGDWVAGCDGVTVSLSKHRPNACTGAGGVFCVG